MPGIRVLNVAEKPSVAREVSALLGKGNLTKRPGKSQYNPIHEFPCQVRGQQVTMVFTSVSGHLMEKDFEAPYRKNWQACAPGDLFHLPVVSYVPDKMKNIFQTLQAEAKKCQWLVLWLDCDREGENIAFEVIEACRSAKPSLQVFRARFSKIVYADIQRAINNLVAPNKADSDAVNARSEADLRIGAAFTRWQTKHLQTKFSGLSENLISYGPCQIPTLGFVVDRFRRIESFIQESFWSIEVFVKVPGHSGQEEQATFSWERDRLFDRLAVLCLYELCIESPQAEVVELKETEKKKWKPFPLNTVEFQKNAARKLHMSSERAMTIAEKLYQSGFISYPRTETQVFEKGTDLHGLIRIQTEDHNWGDYAQMLLDGGFVPPRAGKGNDNSHPPIHPTKRAANLQGDEWKVYELVTRTFLASCSADALGNLTVVKLKVAEEMFSVSGLIVKQLNYLKVYVYQKWVDKNIPPFELHQRFVPTEIRMIDGRTKPPTLLSEADLIATMDKNGIGTDATIAQHIQTLLNREYAEKKGPNKLFSPTTLGLALIDGYDAMGLSISKPEMRAKLESELVDISSGNKTADEVLDVNLKNYRDTLALIQQRTALLDTAIGRYFDSFGQDFRVVVPGFSRCGRCPEGLMNLKAQGENQLLHCPTCNTSLSLPKTPETSAYEHVCPLCNFQVVSVQSRSSTTYQLCPFCYNHPPDTHSDGMNMPCFKCSATCPLSSGSTAPFRPCPLCRKGKFRIKKRKVGNGSIYTASCSEFQSGCKASFSLPDETSSVTVDTSKQCDRCSAPSQPCYHVTINFRKVVPGVGMSASGCLSGCDRNMNDIISLWNQDSISKLLVPPSKLPRTQVSQATPQTASQRNSSFNNLSRGLSATSQNPTSSSSSAAPAYRTYQSSSVSPSPSSSYRSSSTNSYSSNYSSSSSSNYSSSSTRSYSSSSSSRSSGGTTKRTKSPAPSFSSGESPPCECGNPAVPLTVKKEGPNKGRQFYKCEQSVCNFFQWGDDMQSFQQPPKKTTRTGTGRGRGRGTTRGRGRKKRGGASGGGGGIEGMACFKCGEPGHFANSCPNG